MSAPSPAWLPSETALDRDAQRRGLLGVEAEIGQVVVLGADAVADVGAVADRFGRDRHAHAAQRLLVALERAPVRGDLRGIPGDLAHDVFAGERPARVEQQREQVEDAFDPRRRVGHRSG